VSPNNPGTAAGYLRLSFTTMSAGKLVFACGATITAKDTIGHGPGTRLTTFTSPDQKHQRPIPPERPELRMNCLIMCPCTAKASGRKHSQGWFDGGVKGHLVTCVVKAVEPT
jgi:hypothetical protein